ncbi:hypothetical protein ACH5RR_034791 [Cinchona calisaya]|uniref:HECT-type E3 ubiquitin transferase n=1 Tax=Cinchona calisaya TaxID=153742 RepID=A0ABD2YCH1_9GENT
MEIDGECLIELIRSCRNKVQVYRSVRMPQLHTSLHFHLTPIVPLEGFSALQGISGSQKFQIHKAYGSPDHLPSARTCFNQLDLPEYPSKQHLEERLLLAIHEANEGFGFG